MKKMEKKYKVLKKTNNIDIEEQRARIRRTIAEDMQKEKGTGMLPKCLVFLYTLNHRSIGKITEIVKELISHYKTDYNRDKVRYGLDKLFNLGLVSMKTGGELVASKWEDLNESERYAQASYMNFVSNLPKHMKNNYTNTRFYFVNEEGERFVPWACKQLGFDVEENGNSEENKKVETESNNSSEENINYQEVKTENESDS